MKRPLAIAALIFLLILMAVPLILVLSLDRDQAQEQTAATGSAEYLEETGFLLGTVIRIRIYQTDGQEVFKPVFEEISRLEGLLSLNLPDSDISRVNSQAGIRPVKVDPDTLAVVQKGLEYSLLSDGAFDVTIGPLVELWHIGYDDARVPAPEEIEAVLPLIGWEGVAVNPDEGTVFLTRPGMIMDLGGIAKGFIADRCAALLREAGVTRGIVNLGGNVLTLGDKPDGSDFRIGVQDPTNVRGDYVGVLKLRDKSVVSSGVYERFFEENGRRYHHILDPFQGYPVENGLQQVTIVSDRSVDGDGLSTSAFALGTEQGLALLNSLPGVEGIFIDQEKRVFLTRGAAAFFTLEDQRFRLAEPSGE